jgi:hypothetical protein
MRKSYAGSANRNAGCNQLAESLGRVAFTPERIPMPIITTAPTKIQCMGTCTRCAAYASPQITIANPTEYSGFDSGLYRILDAKWHFSQENATLHHLQMTTFESKPL